MSKIEAFGEHRGSWTKDHEDALLNWVRLAAPELDVKAPDVSLRTNGALLSRLYLINEHRAKALKLWGRKLAIRKAMHGLRNNRGSTLDWRIERLILLGLDQLEEMKHGKVSRTK